MEYESPSCQTLDKQALVKLRTQQKTIGKCKNRFTFLTTDAVFCYYPDIKHVPINWVLLIFEPTSLLVEF